MKLFTKLSTLLLCGVAVAVIGCSDLQEDIQGVDVKVENLEKTTSSSIAELQSAIDALKAANAALENQKADKTALDAAKADLQAAFDKKLAEVNAAVSALTAVVDGKASAEDVAALSTKLDEAVKALEATIANIEAALGEKADKDDVDAIAGDVDILKNGYAQTVEALTNIQGVLEGKASQEDVDGIVADLNTLKTGYAQTVEALTNTQGALATLNGNFEDLSAVVETLKTGYAQTVAALTNLNGRMDAIEGRVETLESEVKKLQAAYADLEARLQKTLTDMQAKDEAYETAYADLEARLQKVLSDMQAKDEAFENEFSELNKNLQQALTDLQNITAVNAEDIEALKKAHALTTSDLTNLSFAYYQHLEELADYKASVADQLEALELQDATLLKTIQSEIANAQAYADEAVKALEEKQTKALADLEAKINTAWESERALIYNTIYDIQKTLEGAISEGDAAAIIASKDYTDAQIAMVYKTIVDVQATLENFAVVGDQTLKEAFEEQIAGVYKSILDYFNQANGYADAAVAALAAQIEEGLATVYKTIESEIERAEGYADEAVKAAVEELSAEIYKTLSDEIARACGYADEAAKAALEEALPLVYNTIQSNSEQLTGYIDAEIAALKELLAGDFVSAEDLASQIQSITWVPTTATEATAQTLYTYQYNDGKPSKSFSPIILEATYEVTPASVVKDLANAEVFFSTMPYKSGDEVTFAADIISVDEERGQITVSGFCTEDSEVYSENNFAAALNIVTEKSNVSTNVRSSYVNVVSRSSATKDVKDFFVFYNTATEEVVTSLDDIKVPYNDQTPRALFANIVPAFETVSGSIILAENAKDYFGFDVKFEYTGTLTETKVGAWTAGYDLTKNENKAPVYVTSKKFDATAQITDVIVDGQAKDSKTYVGSKVTLTIGDVKINNNAIASTLDRTFEIDNVVAPAAIIFETAQYDWTPAFGANFGDANDEDWTQDLNVMGVQNILTTLGANVGDDLTFTAEREYTDEDGDHTEVLTATITVRAKNNVAITAMDYKLDNAGVVHAVPFGKESTVTYTFTGSKVSNNATYNMTFDLVMGAMPADKEINLSLELPVSPLNGATNIATINGVNPLTQICADIKTIDPDFAINDIDIPATGYIRTTHVEINGEEPAMTSNYAFIDLGLKQNEDKTYYEESMFRISNSYGLKIGDAVTAEFTYNVAGVEYTIIVDAVITKPNFSIVPNTTFVKNGVVTLNGKKAVGSYSGSTYIAPTTFALNDVILNTYVKNDVPSDYANAFKYRYTILTELTDEQENAGYALPTITNSLAGLTENVYVNWQNVSDLQKVRFEVALVTGVGDDQVVYGTPVEFDVVIPNFVKLAAHQTQNKVKYTNNAQTVAWVAKSLRVLGDLDGSGNYATPLYNEFRDKVTTLASLNDRYLRATDTTANTGAYQIFYQTFSLPTNNGVVDKSKISVKNSDGTDATINYDIDTNGKLTIYENNANITGPITFTIPVTVDYVFDNYTNEPLNAVIIVEP